SEIKEPLENETYKVVFPVQVITHENYTFNIEGMGKDNANCSTGWCDSGMRLMTDNKAPVINISPAALFNDDDIVVDISCSDIGSGIDHVLYACTLSTEKPENEFMQIEFNGELNTGQEVVIEEEGVWY